MAAVFYLNRVGRPWRDMGCVRELEWAYDQRGIKLTEDELPAYERSAGQLSSNDRTYWTALGRDKRAACKVLDVIVTAPREGKLHCFTCVDERGPLFLSSDEKRGVRVYDVRVIPPDNVVGCYRLSRLMEADETGGLFS